MDIDEDAPPRGNAADDEGCSGRVSYHGEFP